MPADLPAKKPSYVQRLKQQIADNNFSAPTQTSPTTTPPTKSNVIDFLRQEVQNPPKTASSTLPVSPQTTTPSQKKSNIIDFAQEKAKRANASFSSSLASSLASSQPTGPFFSLEQLNPQTAIVLASVANGLQKEQFVNLLNGPLKNVLLTAAKIPSYDSRAIEKFSQQAEQEYEQFYQQLASEYKPSLADAKFKEQARQVILSDQEISRLGEEISQTTRDLIDSTQPETFIQNYFQKKGGAFSSSSQTEANSIKEDTSQQKKAQDELVAEKDLSKETKAEEELSSTDSATTSAESSSSSRNRIQESISSETAPSSTSSATSQSSSPQASSISASPQTSSPSAEEPVSTEEKPSRLQQIRQAVKQQAESPQEASSSKETVISPESAAAATGTITATSSPSSADIPVSSPTKASTTGSPLKPEPTVSSPASSPQVSSSPAEEPVSTEEKPSRLQQIRQAVKQQAESPQEVSPSRETVISPESAAAASDAIATTSPSSSADTPASSPTNISEASATGSPLKAEPAVSSPASSPQVSSSQKRSPFVRRKALASQTKSKLSPQNRLQNKAKKVAKKALQKALQALGQFLASILPYIWPLLLGLGTIIAATALATGGVATVVSGGTAVWTAVTTWVSSTFGPFDNAAVQLANQSPLVNKICAQCLTITKTVSLKGGLDTTGEAIDANNAKRAYFTYTITPNTKECSDIKLNGECSDLISIACKNINSESCPGLDPVNYQVPAPLTDVASNSVATKDIPTNYALNTNITSGISEDGNLDIPACNALLRALKTDNLDNYSLTKPITFNLEEFLPNGYPLPYGDDYRLDNNFTLGYSGQPTNQNGSTAQTSTCTSSVIAANASPITPPSSEKIIWSAESATLKSWISQKNGYKLTRIWLSSPGKQINKFGSLLKEYAVNMANSAISSNNLSGKIFIATDASGFHNETAFGKVIITNGQILRDDQNLNQGTEGKLCHYYTFDSNGTLSSYKNTTSSQELLSTYCTKNTFAFYPPMVENGKRSNSLYSTGENRMREGFCQIDSNNYALITGQMDLDDVARIMLELNCKTGINFDGGGSTCLYTKDSTGAENIIFGCTDRKIPDILYFNEL